MVTLTDYGHPLYENQKRHIIEDKSRTKVIKKCVTGVIGDSIKVKLHAPPVEGATNEELIELIAEKLSIKKSSIKIIRGQTSKNKILEIEGKYSIPPSPWKS